MLAISIDPGAHTGVAVWEHDQFGLNSTFAAEEIPFVISQYAHVDEFVVEDYRIRQGKQMAHTGSPVVAARVLGMIQYAAFLSGAHLTYQSPQAYRMGALHFGVKIGKGHIADDLSARLHLLYFLESQEVSRPLIQRALVVH